MQTNIDTPLTRESGCPLRVFPEDHGARRRNGASLHAFENSVGRLDVSSPVICVDDEYARPRRLALRPNRPAWQTWVRRRHGISRERQIVEGRQAQLYSAPRVPA